ncbi:glycosyltransferase [Rhodobacteraceae bacterium]|nr:glycosyltransferase [Paracoccaceae bacterium]
MTSPPSPLPATAQYDLAIVIPVWNLPRDLFTLLGQIADLGIASEVLICDDASGPPCDPATIGFDTSQLGPTRLRYLRAAHQQGAGHARNMGLDHVDAANVMFFDADDQLTDQLPVIIERHMRAGNARPDFTIFRHSDTRVRDQKGREGTFDGDEAQWDLAMGTDCARVLDRQQAAHLSTISAYPWNKIYRTDFLRHNDIRCSETVVHNDIALHWLGFVRAKNILALRNIGAVHVVGARDHHLTTRRGAERLCLAEILHDVTTGIRNSPHHTLFMRHYIQFVDTICRWNMNQIDPEIQERFKALAMHAYLDFTPEEFHFFAHWQPRRAHEIVAFLLNEGV